VAAAARIRPGHDRRVPDLLVVAPVVTGDPARPRAEAALVRDGVFACVGSREECERAAGRGTVRLHAGGAVAGLADAHGHVALLGRWRREASCAGARDAEECARRAAGLARTEPRGAWIRGSGWDQNRWPGARFPTADVLTRAVPDHPAALSRVDGHALWVNAAALAAAGVDARTADPPGGRILRLADGRPEGVLLDAAQDLVLARIPRPGPAELEAQLLAGLREVVRLGLTAVHDAGVPDDALAVYGRLAAEDRLPVRVYAMLDGERPLPELREAMAGARAAPAPGRLTVRSVKLFADGALGSRGAALHEDYADEPGNRGLLLAPPEALAAKVAAAAAAGLQPAVHAIGDRALAVALDALEAAARGADVAALRPRIEHLQILLPREVPRLLRLGAIASMQPVHVAGDGAWVAARLGAGTERLRGAYAWRRVLAAGIPLAFGSDFPVEDPDPRAGLAAAETRAAPGAAPFLPDERLRREEALAAFTRGAAHAAFAEARRGMVREGMDADLTLFAGDVLACPAEALRALPVTHAIVGGRVEHEG
jgi:predicted amidohydrolase YtcJ